MSMSTAAELNDVAVGQYTRPKPTDIRSPCPLLNALANHGYLPRDGRSFHQAELSAALKKVGLSPTLRLVSNPVFLEHQTAAGSQQQRPASSWSKLWYLMRNPWAIFFFFFGMRRPDSRTTAPNRCSIWIRLGSLELQSMTYPLHVAMLPKAII
ncbi:hypothetical protein QC761_200010 [Podospora bellae-mahoneyi]|uniref:Heme haloperoxidase family profile domain-containing protein n=1 Tax=Podospora bellae-mahoneyi TaxID=2093777 RepID=A0ABR0FMS1_9PEZI|nr:hypothetical protein QC761_200010 [Podospora bellae-mahoneyi]